MSLTTVVLLDDVKVGAVASTVTVLLPSIAALSGAVRVYVAEVDPAGIDTEAGRVKAVSLPLANRTDRAEVNVPGMETVPVAVPPSETVAGSVRFSVRVSLSTAVVVAVTGVEPLADAVTVTSTSPSIFVSFVALVVKSTCV